MTGVVFDIQHFSMDDGPGIRTSVFLKGCSLHCLWCHNPEGMSREKQLFWSQTLCVSCGRCLESGCACHGTDENGKHILDHAGCTACGKCVIYCQRDALRIVGREMTVEQVADEVCKDILFYTDGGGMTLSGGEPMLQPAFSTALLREVKSRGINTCMETSGFCREEDILQAAEFTDLFYFDIKITDGHIHRELTGVDNKGILSNLARLSGKGSSIVLRCPVIPGKNDSPENLIAVAKLAQNLKGVMEIHLLPYHTMGLDKYPAVGLTPAFTEKSGIIKETCSELAGKMKNYTDKPVKVIR